jgi:hypothetical protein
MLVDDVAGNICDDLPGVMHVPEPHSHLVLASIYCERRGRKPPADNVLDIKALHYVRSTFLLEHTRLSPSPSPGPGIGAINAKLGRDSSHCSFKR